MKGTLLVIDDKDGSELFLDVLHRHGFFCFHARGPLKVRAVLEKNAVDAIIWKENPGNRALAPDLVAAWRAFPPVPVLHLFPQAAPPLQLQPNPFRETLPAATPEKKLLALLENLAAETRATGSYGPKTELAFRHLFARLRRFGSGRPAEGSPPQNVDDEGEDFRASGTGLEPAERALLASPSRAGRPGADGNHPAGSVTRWLAARFAALRRPQNHV